MDLTGLEMFIEKGIFAVLFMWLFYRQVTESKAREERLYAFTYQLKDELSKLVVAFEKLTGDVNEIKENIEDVKENNSHGL